MEPTLVVCIKERMPGRPSCKERGSPELADKLEKALAEEEIDVPVKRILCLGQCENGPNMRIAPGGAYYNHVTEEDLPEIITEMARVKAAHASEKAS
ncbi:MAG: (2Fe-2S) ferredoxin domain-containing protein [Magnetococcales bacterium]|nr:(2Fe-2S) ferredoxin domain-containing protein [Magnetococcales bacterium]